MVDEHCLLWWQPLGSLAAIPCRPQFVARSTWIDLPRLMTDDQLATVLEEFVKEVRARPPKEPD
jgi:hypothetical protein